MAEFEDRTDAGRRLAAEIVDRGIGADLVLAIPRGGLPLGRAVADALDAPLDVVVSRKIGAPHNPELAIGAVSSDGETWLNDDLIERLGVGEEYLERTRAEEGENARRKAERYRGGRPPPDLEGKRVVIVDDGAATGATMIACIRLVRAAGAVRIVAAVPVGSSDAASALRSAADEVVCLETPATFGAVGQFYRDFSQVRDEEAMGYLAWNG